MPDAARIIGKLECPSCGVALLNSIRCQWGILPGVEYHLGDSVKWMRDAAGVVVPPFKLKDVDAGLRQWNYGSPEFANVIVFDEDIYPENHKLQCSNCEAVIAACIVIIRDGVMERTAALQRPDVDRILGSSIGRANVAIVQLDGTFAVREDWFEHPIEYLGAQA